MDFTVIATVGPSLLSSGKLKEIATLGSIIFRINGAHADGRQAARMVKEIRSQVPAAKIMVDLPGNKVRTANLDQPIRLTTGETFTLNEYQTNFSDFYKYLAKGDIIYANDSIFTFEVIEANQSAITFKSYSDGLLLGNKGLHKQGIHAKIPFLFQRDLDLIETVCDLKVDVLSLSFTRTADDVLEALGHLQKRGNEYTEVFAKIETSSALKNLDAILDVIKTVNIDRGDLSTDVGMLALPAAIEHVVNSAIAKGRNIFLATQFLKNMETLPVPLISEVIDLHRTIKNGVTGIQLSEETAVGKYPFECVDFVFKMAKA